MNQTRMSSVITSVEFPTLPWRGRFFWSASGGIDQCDGPDLAFGSRLRNLSSLATSNKSSYRCDWHKRSCLSGSECDVLGHLVKLSSWNNHNDQRSISAGPLHVVSDL